MDAPLGLGLRHPLHAMGAALELEDRVGALALDGEGHLLEAAHLGRRLREHLGGESALLGVAGQHLVEVAGKQRRLVAPGAGADLDQHVLVVVGVALDHRQPDLLFELLEPRGRLVDHLAQFGVLALLQQLPRALEVVLQRPVLAAPAARRLQLPVLPPDLGIALPIRDHLGIRHLPLELGEAASICRQAHRSWPTRASGSGAPPARQLNDSAPEAISAKASDGRAAI